MIELRNITKSYVTPKGRHYVFRDLSFVFPDDANIALMGRNGAGKSTLMRLLGGIDMPDRGEIVSDVSISFPVSLSSGFQGSLTPRDNARFVCRVHGFSGDALREKMRYVEEFAEIGKYFDLPMKTLSSGMRSRVSFGLSMCFDFDYYLIDEVMAVGDPAFKAKSKAVFKERLKNANMILVSHSMSDIREYCDIVVLVDNGQATVFKDVEAGLAAYQQASLRRPS
jgi:capsular polysaccharide transport system ATP-binding protein